jgi:RimJ/RimL family protein N-acetyltransferase
VGPKHPIVVLEGEAVRLEPLALSHVDALWAATQGTRATYGFTSVPKSPEDTVAYVKKALAMQEAGDALPFATVDRRSGQVVGSTRFFATERWDWPEGSPLRRPSGVDAVEIGYTWLAEAAQRTRINTEAKLLMLRHAFEVWGVRRVNLKTDKRNERSRNAIERIGGKLDGVLRAAMPAFDGGIRDSAVYSILEAEWPGVKAALEAKLRR